MTVLVTIETLILGLVILLLAGLLRSHAEILRALRMGERDESGRITTDDQESYVSPDRRPPRDGAEPAPDLVGETLRGEPLVVGMRPGSSDVLLAFLSSGCLTCQAFWGDLRDGRAPTIPNGGRLVVVTKDRDHESPAKLRDWEPRDVPLLMSGEAWEAYKIPSSPYFVLVDGASATIYGEGSATSWDQVISLLSDAIADEQLIREGGVPEAIRPGDRTARIDRELAAAGIGPGHPSLYSGSESDEPAGDSRPEPRT